MAIDPSIILAGQQQANPFENISQGLQMGQGLRQLLVGRQVGNMRKIDDANERKTFANNSMFNRELNAQIKADDAQSLKQTYDQLKLESEIGKTNSEAFKNNQQGQGYGLDNSGKKLGAIQGAFQQASLTGDKTQVLLGMNALVRTGMMSAEDYQSQATIVNAMNPDELKQDAGGINFANAKDPASIQYQTANNVADNQTSQANSVRSTQASIYSTDKTAQTAANRLTQDGEQFNSAMQFNQQKQYFEQNKPMSFETGSDGYQYAVYANGKGMRVLGEDGQPIKGQIKGNGQMSATSQKELFETTDAVSAGTNAITNLQDALKYSAKAYDGVGAKQRAYVSGMLGESEETTATTMLDNIVTGNALEMLKATFGGAPTEGERAILLQLQGSANLPRAQREAIYTRAIQMAQKRIESNQAKAEGIRDGSFFKASPNQPGAQQAQPKNNALGYFD